MAYLVLARKWRPHVFEDVCGQEHVTKTLANAIKHERIGHAYLFTGSRGVGKTSIARIFSRMVRCQSTTIPCETCQPCKEYLKGSTLDILEIDGASNTGVDSVRELRETVSYRPTSGKYKVYIIDEVHMLSTSAFNALLKTLEEPPSHVIFIFATTEPHKIPYTILSRCQRFDFKRIMATDMAPHLEAICKKENIEITQKGILTLCRAADGSLRDALSILDQIIAYSGPKISDDVISETLGLIPKIHILNILEALIKKNVEQCLTIAHEMYHYGHDLHHFAGELLEHVRLLLIAKLSIKEQQKNSLHTYLPEEEKNNLLSLAQNSSEEELIQMFHILLNGVEEISKSSFPRYALELTLIRMTTVFPVTAIKELLEKISPNDRGSTFEKASFLKTLKEQKPLLAALVEECGWEAISENEVVLKVNINTIGREELTSQKTKNLFESIARNVFKKDVQFKVIISSEKMEVLHPDEHLKKEALQNETIQKARDIFQGTLQTVRTYDSIK